MNARTFACGTRFIYRRRQELSRLLYRPHPERGSHWSLTAHSVSRLHPQSSPTPSIAVHGYTSSAVNSDHCGRRGDRLFPAVCPPLYPDTAHTSRCRARMSAPTLTNYIDGYTAFRCQLATSVCFSEPSMPVCFAPSYNRTDSIPKPRSSHP